MGLGINVLANIRLKRMIKIRFGRRARSRPRDRPEIVGLAHGGR